VPLPAFLYFLFTAEPRLSIADPMYIASWFLFLNLKKFNFYFKGLNLLLLDGELLSLQNYVSFGLYYLLIRRYINKKHCLVKNYFFKARQRWKHSSLF